MIAKEEIWADADGNAVPFNDPRGKTVLFGEGVTISDADAKKHGIVRGKLGGSETEDEKEFVPAEPPGTKTDAQALADRESSAETTDRVIKMGDAAKPVAAKGK